MFRKTWLARRLYQRQSAPRSRSSRLQLEPLEERSLLSTLTVLNLTDHDPGSLRDAIAQAQDNDTIEFDPSIVGPGSTITLTSRELLLNRDLTIHGPGANQLMVDGNHASGVFHVGYDTHVTVSGLTIANGYGLMGGGIFSDGPLTVRHCTFLDNSVDWAGGGIYSSDELTVSNCNFVGNSALTGGGIFTSSTGTVSHCTFTNNSADGGGGGGIVGSGELTVRNSAFSGNSAQAGGAISMNGGVLEVARSAFEDNSAILAGGAIQHSGDGETTVSGSIFSHNSANQGGAIFDCLAPVTIRECLLTANSAQDGGGIYSEDILTVEHSNLSDNTANSGGAIYSTNSLLVTSSTLDHNQAGYEAGAIDNFGVATLQLSQISHNVTYGVGGGGIYNHANAGLTITSCTVSENSVLQAYDGSGGGVLNDGSLVVMSSTLAQNFAEFGGGLNNRGWAAILSSTLGDNQASGIGKSIYNYTGSTRLNGTIVAGAPGPQVDIMGSFSEDSCYNLIASTNAGGLINGVNGNLVGVDPLLAPLGNYGGPTQTMALLPGSPALDAGDPYENSQDQRGVDVQNGRRDIGAFESEGFTVDDGGGDNPNTNEAALCAIMAEWSRTGADGDRVDHLVRCVADWGTGS